MIEIRLDDRASPEVQARAAQLKHRKPLHAAMGQAVAVELRRRFLALDQQGNKRGWPRQHFWGRRVRAATAFAGADDEGASVVVASREFLYKLRGGTIRPGGGRKFLAIPLRAEAAGKMPRANLIPGVFFLRTQRGAFLAVREGAGAVVKRLGRGRVRRSGGARTTGALRLLWKLVPSVTQVADPRAQVAVAGLAPVAMERARLYLERRFAPKNEGGTP